MNINQLIEIVKKKINQNILCDKVEVEDKTFLHRNHRSYQNGKFHIKLKIKSLYLKEKNTIESSKKIYKILDEELKNYIHSIQILID
jgi:BolA protein|tara:strand:- start:82 stop:342 length:261 start_codon:yes stop_codon:yes gene_type:complete